MKTLIQAVFLTGAVAAPAFAQEAPQDMGGRFDAMTCREFLAFQPQDQMTVMLAMRAHVNGDPLPDEPLPIGVEAEIGGADGLGGDSGEASAEGLEAGTENTAAAGESIEAGGTEAAGGAAATTATTEAAGSETADTGATGEGSVLVDEEVVEGENESGKVNADGTEMSVTEEPADPKLTAMRTSCEGGPDALATDAMRAAHADYE